MLQRIVIAVLALLTATLGFLLSAHDDRLELLEREVHALRTSVHGTMTDAGTPRSLSRHPPTPKLPVPLPVPAQAPSPSSPPTPRVPVTTAEIAHVESAVLSLLEADRPELREKLRAVVQEQQKTLEQEQREERRERWVARREARLLEVGNEIGLTDEQRTAVLHIMLATRDQVGDMMQSAATPEAINETRTKTRAVRDEAETQIRQLMSPEQYKTFSERFGDDDDERRGPRRGP